MNQLFAMRVFRCLVEANGFSAAAERLDITHSTVSRQLQQLEAQLGARLLNRTSRQLSLTDAGQRYYAACVDILQRIDAAAEAVEGGQERPSGLLRVSAPLVIGTLELPYWLPAFQQRYPDIQLELSCSDTLVDLVADGFDVALRICTPLADTSLVARLLAVSPMVLVAAPGYLHRMGLPRVAEDLSEHRLLAYGRDTLWEVQELSGQSTQVESGHAFRSDTITALHAATVAGLGVAAFTQATVQADLLAGRLVRVLPGMTLGERNYYALYPHARHLPARVRAFVDFMLEHYRVAGAA